MIIGGLLVLAFVWSGGYIIGRFHQARSTGSPHDHRPRALTLVDQLALPPGAILLAPPDGEEPNSIAKDVETTSRAFGALSAIRTNRDLVYPNGNYWRPDGKTELCWTAADGVIFHGSTCHCPAELRDEHPTTGFP